MAPVTVLVRDDLVATHAAAWAELAVPGPTLTGAQRIELSATVVRALNDPQPLAPWVTPSSVDDWLPSPLVAPAAAHDVAYRVARHAGTLTEAWYDSAAAALGPLTFIEVVTLVCTVTPIVSFRRAVGLEALSLPSPIEGEPSGEMAAELADATLNWVPVASPADQVASVVQAFSSLPSENRRIWSLADVQYMPEDQMIDPHWTRGVLSRAQMELVAMRVAQLRQCFF